MRLNTLIWAFGKMWTGAPDLVLGFESECKPRWRTAVETLSPIHSHESVLSQSGPHLSQRWVCGGTIIISTATVLVCFAYLQRVDVGMYISLMAIGLETAVGSDGCVGVWGGCVVVVFHHAGIFCNANPQERRK